MKHPMRWARGLVSLYCAAALLACGEEGSGDAPCPEGTVRAGATTCVPADGPADGGADLGMDPDAAPRPDAGDDPDGGPAGGLPLAVDEVFAASGYMGDGEAGGITDTEDCPMRGGEARGLCHAFTHVPGEAGWGGVWWQGPAGNWGDDPGYAVPAGATRVQFVAWGAAGGESITFGVGYGPADGFGVEATVELTDSPATYVIDLAGVPYADIAGGFSWVNDGAAGGVEFYVDDIVFAADEADAVDPCTVRCATVRGLADCEGVPAYGACEARCAERLAGACAAEAGAWLGCVGDGGFVCGAEGPAAANGCADEQAALSACEGPAGPATLPFYIDDHFVMSGYMGGGEVDVGDCPDDAGAGTCRRITWTPGESPWVGFFFQHPADNWGDLPGLPLAPGATHIRFRAWGEAGGERANFAAGIGEVDGFSVETGYGALRAMPMDHHIEVPAGVDELVGGFAWFLENPEGAEAVTFYLDDVQWRDDAPPGAVEGGGCTDPRAGNHDPEAAEDDGSCVYPITFAVDMSCHDGGFGQVLISGPFCEWCAEGFPLADDDGDGVWQGTFPFPAGALEYKYIVDGFAGQEDLLDDVQAGGMCAPVTDGANFANRQVVVDGPATLDDTYGRCSACDGPIDPPDPDRPFETVTFDDPEVEYGLRGFGGAEGSSVEVDPTDADNRVGRVIKAANAELWAGVTLFDGPNETVGVIPLDAENTRMTVRVWSPDAGIAVRLKVEDSTDPTVSVETEAVTTAAEAWEVLTFDFAFEADGTAALNPAATHDRASIFFNFGVTGAEAGEKTYYFDDVAFLGGTGEPDPDPDPEPAFETVTFDDPDLEYGLRGFGGAEGSSVEVDPTNADNRVGRVIKAANAELWAGVTLFSAPNETVGVIPLDADNTRMTVRVWSPDAGIAVRLKVEDSTNAAISVETEAVTTVAEAWEVLTFDFAFQADGTAALDPAATYDRASIFFNFGVTGAEAGEKTYYFDDLAFLGGGVVVDPEPGAFSPIDFDDPGLAYTLSGFGGAEEATVEDDPTGAANRVARVVKSAAAELWAGTTVSTGPNFSVPPIPLDAGAPRMTVRVWSPDAGIAVRLKVEDAGDPTISVETEATTTVADAWELLTFDFATQAPGTAAFDAAATYDKVSIFFNFGVTGAEAGEKVYFFDDIAVP